MTKQAIRASPARSAHSAAPNITEAKLKLWYVWIIVSNARTRSRPDNGVAMERFRQRCQNEHRARAGKYRVSIGQNVLLVPPLVEPTLHAYSMQPAYRYTGS
jgi:hypothetical protein